ncbi:MAG: tetratricopeptide repeat protein [Deinococcales bacterium]
MLRFAPVLIAFLLPLAFAQDAFSQMQDLLDRGYYNSAAQLNGPELIKTYPDRSEAHYLYADALYLTGNLDAAKTQLDAADKLASSQTDPKLLHLGGLLKAAQGDPSSALTAMQSAFTQTQDYTYAMDWGRVAWQAGAFDQALQAFQDAAGTEQGKTSMWPLLDQGRILIYLGRYQDAIQKLNRAIDVFDATDSGGVRPGSPAYVEAFYRLGQVYEKLGNVSEAETNYRSARTADPNYAPAIDALDRLSRTFP